MRQSAEPTDEEERAAPPRAPLRVMQVIDALSQATDGLSLAQLSDALRLPKTSLFSLLRSLESGGYVVSENGHHRLGQETYGLAQRIQKADGFPGNLRPWLLQLHRACEETVLIGVPGADWSNLIYVDVIEASSWLRYSANVGARRPMYSTALGLAMLAFAAPARQRRYLASAQLDAVTAHTLTTQQALQGALAQIAQTGYALSSGSIDGATGVSAPVLDRDGTLHAAVGMAGPTGRVERNQGQFIEAVMRCGAQMSRALGYEGTYPGTGA